MQLSLGLDTRHKARALGKLKVTSVPQEKKEIMAEGEADVRLYYMMAKISYVHGKRVYTHRRVSVPIPSRLQAAFEARSLSSSISEYTLNNYS